MYCWFYVIEELYRKSGDVKFDKLRKRNVELMEQHNRQEFRALLQSMQEIREITFI